MNDEARLVGRPRKTGMLLLGGGVAKVRPFLDTLLPTFYGVQSESPVPLRNYPIPDIHMARSTPTLERLSD